MVVFSVVFLVVFLVVVFVAFVGGDFFGAAFAEVLSTSSRMVKL